MKRNGKDNWLRLSQRQESLHEDKLSLKHTACPSGVKRGPPHAPLPRLPAVGAEAPRGAQPRADPAAPASRRRRRAQRPER